MPRYFTAAPRRETLLYRNQSLSYTLVFRSRRTIGFAVRPDGSVHISAPAGTSAEWVAQQVLKKADWILKHQETFANRPAPVPARNYAAARLFGDAHALDAGSPRATLAVRAAALLGGVIFEDDAEGRRTSVTVAADELVLSAPAPLLPAQAEALLHAWYARQAEPLFAESLTRVWPHFAEFNLTRPTLAVRQMRTRWGSCTPRTARIRLSPELVRARPECLDYVLLHECCHLLVGDHSKAFYDLQTRLMPDWEHWKTKLNALPK